MSKRCFLCNEMKQKVHCFPKNRALLNAWLVNIGKSYLMEEPGYYQKLQKKYKLCSDHFSDWCYTSTERKTLIHYAVPCKLYPSERTEYGFTERRSPSPDPSPSSEQSIRPKVKVRSQQCEDSEELYDEEEEREVLLKKLLQENFTADQYRLVLSQLHSPEHSKSDTHWSAKDKTIALSIYLKSASTYELLIKHLHFPSITTLGCLMSNVSRDKKFYSTVLKCLEKQNLEISDKLCIVSVDESSKSSTLSAETNE